MDGPELAWNFFCDSEMERFVRWIHKLFVKGVEKQSDKQMYNV